MWIVVVGAIAGLLAALIVKGRGFGLIGNIVVGIIGAVIGSNLLRMLGVTLGSGLVGSLLSATFGAVMILLLVGLIKKS